MRIALCLLLICCMLIACAPLNAVSATEHDADAGAHGYRETTVFCLNADGLPTASQKMLPLQSDMESYALSFVLAGSDATYTVKRDRNRVKVDIVNFPAFPSQSTEAAAIAGIVNTMLAFRDTGEVTLTFDGISVEALPHGTQANTVFTEPIMVDEAG